jgi:hypothetical protein
VGKLNTQLTRMAIAYHDLYHEGGYARKHGIYMKASTTMAVARLCEQGREDEIPKPLHS